MFVSWKLFLADRTLRIRREQTLDGFWRLHKFEDQDQIRTSQKSGINTINIRKMFYAHFAVKRVLIQ